MLKAKFPKEVADELKALSSADALIDLFVAEDTRNLALEIDKKMMKSTWILGGLKMKTKFIKIMEVETPCKFCKDSGHPGLIKFEETAHTSEYFFKCSDCNGLGKITTESRTEHTEEEVRKMYAPELFSISNVGGGSIVFGSNDPHCQS